MGTPTSTPLVTRSMNQPQQPENLLLGRYRVLARRGTGGFGYDPLFLYEPLNKTFAEVTEEEKNQISHRARACEKMLEIMKGLHE